MKTAFLVNPSARWKPHLKSLISEIENRFLGEKEIFLVDRSQPDSTEKHLGRIARGEFTRIVVAGGDGTLNRTINFLKKQNISDKFSLGIIPFGTCNDFARFLRLKAGRVRSALRVIARGHEQTVCVARVNDCYFINNAGFGKKNPAEIKSPAQVIREMQVSHVSAVWDDKSFIGDCFMMLCANAPYFSSGLHFSRKSDPSDDLLEFFFVRKMTRARLFFKLLVGRARIPLHFLPNRSIVRVETKKMTVYSDRPVAIVVDGESVPGLSRTREAVFETAGTVRFVVRPETFTG